MSKNISRREFLKLGAINAAGFASLWAFGKNVFGDTIVDSESTVSTIADTSSNAIITVPPLLFLFCQTFS